MFTQLQFTLVVFGFILSFGVILTFSFIGASTAFDPIYATKIIFGLMLLMLIIFSFLITKLINNNKFFEE
jgi:hypothetical protein